MTTPIETIEFPGQPSQLEPASPAEGVNIALVGRLGGMNRKEATNLVRSAGAAVVDVDHARVDWVVIGADEPPLSETVLLSQPTLAAAASGELEILHETQLWQRLGLVDVEQSIRSFHTPAMLAHLLDVPVSVIRRWQRRGLITPIQTVHRLPYFDFQEVATARRLAAWIASGASEKAIEQRLVELVEIVPDIRRPLDQLSILVEGKQVLLRDGEGLLEPSGQMRFDFEPETFCVDDEVPDEDVVSFSISSEPEIELAERDELLAAAFEAEDNDKLSIAVDYYHAILGRDGPRADICFQIAEVLYRSGEIMAARERYYMAVELDPEFVEARASLGNVLAETGQLELAVAAFQGALTLHPDYADVHFGLARILDSLGRDVEATTHWRRFVQIAPESPWAKEANERLLECENSSTD